MLLEATPGYWRVVIRANAGATIWSGKRARPTHRPHLVTLIIPTDPTIDKAPMMYNG